MRKYTLAAASISNRLGNADRAVYSHDYLGMTFTSRHCKIGGKRSGGLVLTAEELHEYKHGKYPKETIRLKKGYILQTKLRAIQRLIDTIAEARIIRRKRELIHSIAESHDINVDKIDQISETENHTTIYSDMNMADCEFWEIELKKFPLKDLTPELHS